jgi:dienelactone hydrolase
MKAYLTIVLCFLSHFTYAQVALNTALGEEIVMVKKSSGIFGVELETTIYRPTGTGPFPVVIINHGKQSGDPKWQARAQYPLAARYFLSRGYLVVLPMRQGFSKSTGQYIGGGCNVHSNGLVQAEDVVAVIEYLKTQSFADSSRIVVAGQSHGGLTTMAVGALNHPDVKGLINFAGGLRQVSCAGWEHNLARAFGSYGAKTTQPSLWFYGDNDSYWQTWLYKEMHQKYIEKGANAKLIAYGNFGSDAHSMFGSRDGEKIWQPEVTQFLTSIGMPSEVKSAFAKFASISSDVLRPQATDFAALADDSKVPFIPNERRSTYKDYLTKTSPRAFAVAPNGALGWANGGDAPTQRALEFCNRRGQGQCKLYSVDEDVVWNP